MAPQLVPSRDVILLTMSSQGWQNVLQKADQLTLDSRGTVHGWVVSVAIVLCNKIGSVFVTFPKSSHI